MNLVLLHALPLDASMWRSTDLGAVAPDLYRLGDSIEAWAAGVLDLAGAGPLVLVGSSVGGSCAIEVAWLAPERVRLLVLVGAKPGHRPEPDFRDEAVRVLSEEGMAAAWPRYWAPLLAPDADPLIVDRARRIAMAQDIDDVVRGVRVFHSRPDRSAFVESWEGPIVVVSGEHDPRHRNAAVLASTLRHGVFRPVPGAGHYVPLERPTELAAIVSDAIGRLP